MPLNELIDACRRACETLAESPLHERVSKRLRKDAALREQTDTIRPLLHACGLVHRPERDGLSSKTSLKAVAWNIERGKRFDALVRTLTNHPELKDADVYFLTEVDWGMARSGNRNIAADLGKALGFHAYFAPSYFNLTAGHGFERHISGTNELGLHGKAILSRLPLENLRVAAMPNAINKLKSKEVRIGQKRSLLADLPVGSGHLSLACVHLDAFSSPRMRALQFRKAVQPLLNGHSGSPALIAGDWNTNTLNSTSGKTMFASVVRQLLSPGPKRMISEHHAHPERKFDRPLFKALASLGLSYEDLNEDGVGTFDLLFDDMELGQMAKDQFPEWLLRWINRIVGKSGGQFSLKLDWFAARGLRPLLKKVVRLTPGPDRPSDHHPILLTFNL